MLIPVNRNQTVLLKIILITLLILGLFLCNFSCKKYEDTAGPPETIRIGAFKGEFAALVWLAESEGLFAKYGLKAQVTGFDSGLAAVESLMAGAQDLATAADYVFVHKTLTYNTNLKIISEIARSDSFQIVARSDRGIFSPTDLKGKRIALTLQTPSYYFLDRYLIYHHIDPRSVTIVDHPPLKLVEAISLGDVDAVITWEPYVWNIQQKLPKNSISWPAQADQQFHFLLISGAEFAEKRPGVARKVFLALSDAEALIRKDPSKMRQKLARQISLNEQYLAAVWSKHVIELSLDQTLLVALEDQSSWAINKGLAPAKKQLNFLSHISKGPLVTVKPEAVTLFQ